MILHATLLMDLWVLVVFLSKQFGERFFVLFLCICFSLSYAEKMIGPGIVWGKAPFWDFSSLCPKVLQFDTKLPVVRIFNSIQENYIIHINLHFFASAYLNGTSRQSKLYKDIFTMHFRHLSLIAAYNFIVYLRSTAKWVCCL